MRGHSECFYEAIRKIIPKLSLLPLLIWTTAYTYIVFQNLSPVLTRMTKEVDAREKELTHQVHREMLIRSLEQVKNLTPVLISGIKIFITAKQTSKLCSSCSNNRLIRTSESLKFQSGVCGLVDRVFAICIGSLVFNSQWQHMFECFVLSNRQEHP